MPHLPHLADRVVGRPLLLHPDKIQVILWALQGRIGLHMDTEALQAESTHQLDASQLAPQPEASRFRGRRSNHGPYRIENGAAILPIVGSLVNRGAWVGAYSGLVSYEGIEAQLDAALADNAVSHIVLDIDSPGGEATGMFRLAEKLRAARQQKPITAFVNDMAASAAYGIAASTSRIVVSPSSIVGSIGVVMVHLDRSAEFEKKGQRPTLIFAGAHKVDGHPFAALPENVRADLQTEVEKFYALFVASVAAGRPQFSDDAIRATEARTFLGEEAVKLGLADAIGSFEDALAGPPQTRRHQPTEKTAMTEQTTPVATTPAPAVTTLAQALDQSDTKLREAHASGLTEGATAERTRIKAILGSDAAKGRTALAEHLAYETDWTPVAATAMLEKAPREVSQPATPDYTARKEAAGTLGLGLPEAKSAAREPVRLNSADIYANRRAANKTA